MKTKTINIISVFGFLSAVFCFVVVYSHGFFNIILTHLVAAVVLFVHFSNNCLVSRMKFDEC